MPGHDRSRTATLARSSGLSPESPCHPAKGQRYGLQVRALVGIVVPVSVVDGTDGRNPSGKLTRATILLLWRQGFKEHTDTSHLGP